MYKEMETSITSSPVYETLRRWCDKFFLMVELSSYHRVLRECGYLLSDDIRKNIYDDIQATKMKLSQK
jgi:hypothetical protein